MSKSKKRSNRDTKSVHGKCERKAIYGVLSLIHLKGPLVFIHLSTIDHLQCFNSFKHDRPFTVF